MRRLLADEWPVRAMTRDPPQLDARRLSEQGVEVVAADFRDPPSMVDAMSGARGVFSVQNMLADEPDQEARDGMAGRMPSTYVPLPPRVLALGVKSAAAVRLVPSGGIPS